MRILLAQINPIIADIKGNTQKIIAKIEKGKREGADLVLFSEMALVGYPPQDFVLLPHFIEEASKALNKVIEASKGIAVIVGTVRRNLSLGEKPLHNTAAIIEDGKLLGYQDKMLLPTYDVFDERRFFEPAAHTQLWKVAGSKIGVTICEDIWRQSNKLKYASYQRNPVEELAALSPSFVVNLSASPFSLEKFPLRLHVCQEAAKALNCPLLFCNQVGGNDSLLFDGKSLYVDEKGILGALAKGFTEDDLLIDTRAPIIPHSSKDEIEQNLYAALVMGIRDYFHKSGFKKACLGLSGGIDSAVVACLAAEALGKENVLGLLMPSRYSSGGSVDDAALLAKNLGIATEQISIEGPFKAYLELLTPFFEKHAKSAMDTTEENMQARIRGMILMAFSNKLGYVVLSTGNKSEMGMGYMTLYGDMCGGLAVLGDVIKEEVYKLAHWINREREIIPRSTIEKAPSAELRPNQKDSDSLPEYPVVDNILKAYIAEHKTPQEIASMYGYPLDLINQMILKIHQNEYKRRQAPPSLRVSEKAFSVGRHFPIVQKFVI